MLLRTRILTLAIASCGALASACSGGEMTSATGFTTLPVTTDEMTSDASGGSTGSAVSVTVTEPTSGASGGAGVCGDGVTDEGEACDDGNVRHIV